VRDRLLRDGYVILAVVFVALRLLSIEPWADSVDAYAYWSTRDGVLYGDAAGRIGAYLYSPAFAHGMAVLTWLPLPIFTALWTAILLAIHGWLAGPRLALVLLLFIPIPFEIVSGNVHLLYAAVIVLGFSRPYLWALPLLTKVTPGVGLVWFAVRREWRSLGIALGATSAIVAVSWLLAAPEWATWFDILRRDATEPLATTGWYLPIPLLWRLPLAVALIAWGGLTDRRWTVPVGVTLALPVLWLNGLAILLALVPMLAPRPVGIRWPFAARRPRVEASW
jgi:hypothetical protein